MNERCSRNRLARGVLSDPVSSESTEFVVDAWQESLGAKDACCLFRAFIWHV